MIPKEFPCSRKNGLRSMSSSTRRQFFLGITFSNALESRETGALEIFSIDFKLEESCREANRLMFLIPLFGPDSSMDKSAVKILEETTS